MNNVKCGAGQGQRSSPLRPLALRDPPPLPTSPALQQLLVLRLEHMELLGEADDDHEEQQHHQRRGAHGQTHHLELGHHRLAASALVPDVILDVTSGKRKEETRGQALLLLHSHSHFTQEERP